MSEQTQQAVSPVVAVILMVAITVILSAVIGTFVLNIGQQATGSSHSNIGVTTSHSNGNFTATVITGSADELKLLVNGTEVDNLSNPSAGDRVSATVSKQATVTIVSVTDGERSVTMSTTIGQSSSSTVSAPTEGLVAYWLLDDSANDSVGSHDGTVYGDASPFNDSSRGSVYEFDGSGDYIAVSDHSDLEPKSITVAGWVKLRELGDTNGLVGKYDSSASNRAYMLAVNKQNTTTAILKNASQKGPRLDGTTELKKGTWYHLTVTYNHSTGDVRLYLNGSVEANATFNGPVENNSENVRLGDGGHDYWLLNGTLDEVRMYNRSLSKQEVSDLYEATK